MATAIVNPPDTFQVAVGDRVSVVMRSEFSTFETEPDPLDAAQHVAGQIVAAHARAGWTIALEDVFGGVVRFAPLYQVQQYAIAWRVLRIPPGDQAGSIPVVDVDRPPGPEPEELQARAAFGVVVSLAVLGIALALTTSQVLRWSVIPEGARSVLDPAAKIATALAVIVVALVAWRLAT